MSFDGNGSKGLQELNCDQRGARKGVKDEIVLQEQRPFEEDERRIGAKDLIGGTSPQQQLKGSMVCWERFLQIRSLKVLLVENDDSTRHVLTALLRNCSYEVIEAADGLQAWKILENLTNHIDLVLTEVVVPCLSGIGLLSKIMNHKTRKNVPVIMMSSHDSMVLVFKCLSKGAVDFLVKPIRKNELKNLWQHVWRRCHSSSGSGSQSGTHMIKSIRSKSDEESDDGGSNVGEENGSIGLNLGNGSDNGSGTQCSWRKQTVEVESHEKLSLQHQTGNPHDRTFPPIIHPNAETQDKQLVSAVASEECREHKRKIEFLSLKEQAEDADVKNKGFYEVEPSLRGLKGSTSLQDGRNVLRRSGSSAFSRYNSALNGNNNKAFNFLRNSSTGIAVHDIHNVRSKSSGNNDIDTGYRIDNALSKHLSSNTQQIHPLLACHPVKCELSRGPVEGKMDNFTINRSTSGANYFTEVNTESDHGVSGFSGREIENKSAIREAALIKFRQKRKERCFRKKVRYQSRQKLAEQRPRVKGQFVKFVANADKISEN